MVDHQQQPQPVSGKELPLKITVVGAGIGGLAAALALRRKGHYVSLYERSQFKAEHGAAITMTPNASSALEHLGVDIAAYGAVQAKWVTSYDNDRQIQQVALDDWASKYQSKYQMIHRVDLHTSLKDAALSPDGLGPPAKLHLGSKVKSVDTKTAMVEFEDGSAVYADVVIGADGIASATRSAVSDAKPFSSGKNAFRFTLDMDLARADPALTDFLKHDGEMKMFKAMDRSAVMYPARWNKVLNVAVIHPEEESEATSTDFNHSGDKETMLEVAKCFGPQLRALLELADPKTVNLWKLFDMAVLKEWTKDRFTLLGDGAHPFLPYQASGGGLAIEDAVALAESLPVGVQLTDVSSRLKLYQSIRQDRVDRIQSNTRRNGRDEKDYLAQMRRGMMTLREVFVHSEPHNSAHLARQYEYEQNSRSTLSMPVAFGPSPTARQDALGRPQQSQQVSSRTISVEFKTSRTLLKNFFPNSSFSFVDQTDTVVSAILRFQEFKNVSWLGGQGYNTFGLYIPGVEYKDSEGKVTQGSFPIIIFEDLADAVTSDREQLGLPALYASLEGGLSQGSDSAYIRASWRGTEFASVNMQNLRAPMDADSAVLTPESLLTWRYLPKLGASAKAHAEHAICIPQQKEQVSGSATNIVTTESSMQWMAGTTQSLPTLNHIVSRVAELPNFGVIRAGVTEGTRLPTNEEAFVI